ncbi:hypothetical protein SAMN00120144_3359 [Hymenobacter roseosalivarius DSM 11622]|uniref:Uncharacterized protein n=1 Tax=Hymenobacter roseosalivarius DSM 11622 TaxID=645990 RepID=A0A1W1UJH5_9BACT|nr:hypothetical protein SAMN00120144_3359 [Hymenobacter roseosalivarius DSM 11622]
MASQVPWLAIVEHQEVASLLQLAFDVAYKLP